MTAIYDSGNRTAAITVTASSGFIANGAPSNLVNGLKGDQGTVHNCAFATVTLSGSRWVMFDYGYGASVLVTEVSWYAEALGGNPASQGQWKWQGSDDLVTWQDIGQSFTLYGRGFSTADVHDLSASTEGFRAYRMIGISGQTNGGLWQAEVNFKREYLTTVVERPLAIFLFSGQSNSEGQAPNPDQSVYANRARIQSFALDGTWKPAADPLMAVTGSIWPVLNNTNNPATSPAMSFADTMAPLLANFDVGVVVSAKGSTSIDQWAYSTDPQTLCGAMLERAELALASAPAGSFIAGFVWQQGENETYTEAGSLAWKLKLDTLIAAVRSHLELPDLPVAVIGLGPNPGGSLALGWSVLSGIQQFMTIEGPSTYVYSADLPNTASAADWLNTTSVIEIGERAANQFRPLLPPML